MPHQGSGKAHLRHLRLQRRKLAQAPAKPLMIIGLVGGALLTQLQEVIQLQDRCYCCDLPPLNPFSTPIISCPPPPLHIHTAITSQQHHNDITHCYHIITTTPQAHTLKITQRQREQQRHEETLLRQHLLAKSKQLGAKKLPLGGVSRPTFNFSQKTVAKGPEDDDKDANHMFDLMQSAGDTTTLPFTTLQLYTNISPSPSLYP